MKIAITTTEPSLDSAIDPRFGRCPYLLIVETDDLTSEAVENSNAMLSGGAGIQTAQLMNARGVGFVLTGNCGPNAYRTLSAAGIQVVVGCSGMARDVVEKFKAGQLSAANQPNVAAHSGTGSPTPDSQPAPAQPFPATDTGQQPPMPGMGMGGGGRGGMGGGRGRGRGGGGGRGRGMGRGMGGGAVDADTSPPAPIPKAILQSSQPTNKQDELRLLTQQAEAMGKQMQQIEKRIRQLKEKKGT